MNKIVHLCWFGNYNMTKLNYFTLLTIHKQNPDWRIVVYTSKQDTENYEKTGWIKPFEGQDCFPMIKELPYVEIKEINLYDYGCMLDGQVIAATDIFRQKILFEHGGVYSDFDVIWLKPFEYIREVEGIGDADDFQCSVCLYDLIKGHHNMSVIIAEKGSEFVGDIIEMINNVKPPYFPMCFGTTMFNREFPTLTDITNKYSRILALPYKTFFPYSIFNLETLYHQNRPELARHKDVMCIHWFGGHGYSYEYCKEEKGFSRDCSMTSILKQEGLI